MNRTRIAALRGLLITVTIALMLLALWRLWPEGPLVGLAIGGFGLVAGPILILVLIDTGRAMRRQSIGPSAKLLWSLPQVLLGSVACLAGLGGLAFIATSAATPPALRMYSLLVSFGALIFGIGLLLRVKDDRD